MSVKVSSQDIIDPSTLILKKYFSIGGRRNHNIDIFHDKANIFPQFSSFHKKPCCKVKHKRHEDCELHDHLEVPEIVKSYLPQIVQKKAVDPRLQTDNPMPTLKELRVKERLQQLTKLRDNEEKKKIQDREDRERRIKIGHIEETKKVNLDSFSEKQKNSVVKGGQTMIEKSMQLLRELKSPHEIFMNIHNQEKKNDIDSKKPQKEKEKLRKLVKRLDVGLENGGSDDVRKALENLQEIPIKYYKKARERKERKEERSQRVIHSKSFVTEAEVKQDYSSIPLTSNRNSPLLIIDLSQSPMKGFSRRGSEESGNQTRLPKMRGLEVAKRESKLFFSPLNRYLSTMSRSKLNSEASPFSVSSTNRQNKTMDHSPSKVSDTSVWIQKVLDIKQGVNDCLEEVPSQMKYLEECAEVLQTDAEKLEAIQSKEKEESDDDDEYTKGDYSREEQEEIINHSRNRGVEVYTILKNALGGSSGGQISLGSKASKEFYKKIALKERRKADKLIACPQLEKNTSYGKSNGRLLWTE